MLKSEMQDLLSDVEDVLTDDRLSEKEKLEEIENLMLPDDEDDN